MKKMLTFKSRLVWAILALAFLQLNCSKDSVDDTSDEKGEDPIEEPADDDFNYTSSAVYNLNVVYFVPKDSEARVESHRRLSEILLQGQAFYKAEMERNGFGAKTFNMLVDKDKGRVKITYIDGKFGASNYPYEGGGNKMRAEIDDYYQNNPSEKTSDHVLVLSPVEDPQNSDAPYYGLGKYCFATDYDDMDIKYLGGSSQNSTLATTYIGGLLHELGHGLNLPHNKEKRSDQNSPERGTALMGAGNYTYGSTPTFLTGASCSILANNQVFSQQNATFYSGANASFESLNANFENNNINVSGTISTDVPVSHIAFYHDGQDDTADYDAVSWFTVVENGNFDISMPIDELHKKGNTDYALRMRLSHVNGDITNISKAYRFVNGVPSIDFGDKDYLPKTAWSLIDYSSQEDGGGESSTGRAADILDDDPQTYWHTCWTGGCSVTYPHSLTVNVGDAITVDGFAFQLRENLSRSIKDIEIEISSDNEQWENVGSYQLQNVNGGQNIVLDSPKTFSYFRLIAKSSHDGMQHASLAEVYCF